MEVLDCDRLFQASKGWGVAWREGGLGTGRRQLAARAGLRGWSKSSPLKQRIVLTWRTEGGVLLPCSCL